MIKKYDQENTTIFNWYSMLKSSQSQKTLVNTPIHQSEVIKNGNRVLTQKEVFRLKEQFDQIGDYKGEINQ